MMRDAPFLCRSTFESSQRTYTMSWLDLHPDAKTTIARTSISAWNAIMRADPQFGRYALSDIGRSDFIAAFTVEENGTWTVGGVRHRVGGPAVIYADGGEDWYERGKLHRVGGPAYYRISDPALVSVKEAWFEHGRLHRIGGPARTYADGGEEWYNHGKRHRVGGPAIICSEGRKEWFEHDERHRIGGPAITHEDGPQMWYEHGKLHRIGGPARTYVGCPDEWWEYGVRQATPH